METITTGNTQQISKKDVDHLVKDALDTIPYNDIYSESLKYVALDAMMCAGEINGEEIAMTFAVAGFAAGIRFALSNITFEDVGDDKTNA